MCQTASIQLNQTSALHSRLNKMLVVQNVSTVFLFQLSCCSTDRSWVRLTKRGHVHKTVRSVVWMLFILIHIYKNKRQFDFLTLSTLFLSLFFIRSICSFPKKRTLLWPHNTNLICPQHMKPALIQQSKDVNTECPLLKTRQVNLFWP